MAEPPKIWEFSGPCGRSTHYRLQVIGRPSARALRHIIKQLELSAEFVDEPAESPAPADVGSASLSGETK